MNVADIDERVLEIFLDVAPDVDRSGLRRDIPFRDQFDFDSMDTLNFAIGLHEAFGLEIPETDYRELASLGKAVDYVRKQVAGKEALRG